MLGSCRLVASSRAAACNPLLLCKGVKLHDLSNACAPGHDTQNLIRAAGSSSASWTSPRRNIQTAVQSYPSAVNLGVVGRPRVCVVGGGFGGLYTAIRLESLLWPRGTKPQVTLVDQNERFVFKPLLYELINNTADEQEVAPLFSELLAAYPIEYIQAQVSSIEPSSGGDDGLARGGVVQLADGAEVNYDYLVVALGAASDSRGVPGVMEHAVPFNSYDDAMRVKASLDAFAASATAAVPPMVAVVGAGYAGVELASVVAERLAGKARVRLITPGPDILAPGAPEGQRETARKALQAAGIEIMTDVKVKGLSPLPGRPAAPSMRLGNRALPQPCSVQLELVGSDTTPNGTISGDFTADLVVWTAGSSPAAPTNRKGFPFPTNQKGSVLTDRTLQVRDHATVFAVGDVSETGIAPLPPGESPSSTPAPFPQTAQVAFQQADYVAWNIWASINKRPLLPFRYQHLGSMMSLGQLNGAVALPIPVPPPLKSLFKDSPLTPLFNMAGVTVSPNDPDNGLTLEGPLAALARRAAYLYRQPTNEQRINVASSWLQQAVQMAGGLGRGGARTR